MTRGADPAVPRVRDMTLEETELRIGYFHRLSDAELLKIGVDRTLLPSPEKWRQRYVDLYRVPVDQREEHAVAWTLQEQVVGFSTLERITRGRDAFMHLHLLHPASRGQGLGRRFVLLTVACYLSRFELNELHCEPNAFNIAPNRTLQSAGFRYQSTRKARPTPINYLQPVTRWTFFADRTHRGALREAVQPVYGHDRSTGGTTSSGY